MTEPIRFFLPGPTYVPEEIRQAMDRTLCRCMTYYRVQAAIKRVARGATSSQPVGQGGER